jgi:hypothetical protein
VIYKLGGKCVECGEADPHVLQVDEHDKSLSWSQRYKAILDEKCFGCFVQHAIGRSVRHSKKQLGVPDFLNDPRHRLKCGLDSRWRYHPSVSIGTKSKRTHRGLFWRRMWRLQAVELPEDGAGA